MVQALSLKYNGLTEDYKKTLSRKPLIQSDPDYLPQEGDQIDSPSPVNSDMDDIPPKRGKKIIII